MASASETRYGSIYDLARFTHDQLELRGRISPGYVTLAALFRVMYAASMATEEGQAITFELTGSILKIPIRTAHGG